MIEKLVDVCADSTTAGHLTAEGCRLLCVLVKYSKNAGIYVATCVCVFLFILKFEKSILIASNLYIICFIASYCIAEDFGEINI